MTFKPWQHEPDEFKFEVEGRAGGKYRCQVLRNVDITGTLCGYVVIPEGHPYLRPEHQDEVADLDVHGGITHHNGAEIGFDCGHGYDYMPRMPIGMAKAESYRTIGFVVDQLAKLIYQLDAIYLTSKM